MAFVCWHLVRINSFQCHAHASFEDDIGCVLVSLRTKPEAVQPWAEIMTFEIQPAVPDLVLIFWPHFHASTCIMMRVPNPGLIGHHRFRHGLLRTVRYCVFPWLFSQWARVPVWRNVRCWRPASTPLLRRSCRKWTVTVMLRTVDD